MVVKWKKMTFTLATFVILKRDIMTVTCHYRDMSWHVRSCHVILCDWVCHGSLLTFDDCEPTWMQAIFFMMLNYIRVSFRLFSSCSPHFYVPIYVDWIPFDGSNSGKAFSRWAFCLGKPVLRRWSRIKVTVGPAHYRWSSSVQNALQVARWGTFVSIFHTWNRYGLWK